MGAYPDNVIMAMFCDFENVALGVRDANYEKFDIKPVLERLLLKGSIVVKKAYCDWERYKVFKTTMHEANFELIEIPHVRQSGKNSADIRMVVDALDLCYTKSHVNTFVIVSGDSDFSPLVSKLRENAKYVIGVGVKQSTSDLLIANCDDFIYYDDLVRETQRSGGRRDAKNDLVSSRPSPDVLERRKREAVELAAQTFEALLIERGETGKIWASMLKDAIKRRKPGFNEGYYGFRTFGNLLDEAQARGLFEVGREEKSGAYVFRSQGQAAGSSLAEVITPPELVAAPEAGLVVAETTETAEPEQAAPETQPAPAPNAVKRRGRGRGRTADKARQGQEAVPEEAAPDVLAAEETAIRPAALPDVQAAPSPLPAEQVVPVDEASPETKPAARTRRPRKPKVEKAAGGDAPDPS